MPEPDGTNWTIETLYTHLSSIMDERDRRYEQRFLAQEKAVDLALQRVDKEFHEHLQQVRDENRLALAHQDKAVLKQEQAMEKRFDAVNEFRAQLYDQAANFLPRNEYDRSLGGLAKRVDELHTTMLERIESSSKACTAAVEVVEGRVTAVESMVR